VTELHHKTEGGEGFRQKELTIPSLRSGSERQYCSNRNITYLNEMEGELEMRCQETCLTHQVLAKAVLAAESTRALTEDTDRGTATKSLPDE